jgi:Restriction alleviation protein Lar
MPVELLPCPFCGGKAKFERVGNRRVSTIIVCTDCSCTLETGEEWAQGSVWNTRARTSSTCAAGCCDDLNCPLRPVVALAEVCKGKTLISFAVAAPFGTIKAWMGATHLTQWVARGG